jgi:hypothetical protein
MHPQYLRHAMLKTEYLTGYCNLRQQDIVEFLGQGGAFGPDRIPASRFAPFFIRGAFHGTTRLPCGLRGSEHQPVLQALIVALTAVGV